MKVCNACGKCCVKYSNGQLSASPEDLQLWSSFKPGIAKYVQDGKIWYNPASGELIERCPWLRKDPKTERLLCDIYSDRPEDCRVYPATVEDMINDDCEMLEPGDLDNIQQARRALAQIAISDS